MRLTILLSIIILATACTQQKESTTQTDIDSTQSALKTEAAQKQLAIDTSIFVSHVMVFDETKEFYVSLYALKDFSPTDTKYVESELDSVVYEGEEIKRTRLPLHVANRYFNLTGLSRITVYTKEGKVVTDGKFERVEYLEGVIESEYVAVFRPLTSSWNTSDVTYCIASANTFLHTPVPYEVFNDEDMTSRLLKRFGIDSTKVWKVEHLHFLKDHHIWSLIAVDPGSYIIETTGAGSSTLLHQLTEDYSIMEIMPINIDINGKPVLLATAGVNETDFMWSTLLVYKQGDYHVMKTGRIEE